VALAALARSATDDDIVERSERSSSSAAPAHSGLVGQPVPTYGFAGAANGAVLSFE